MDEAEVFWNIRATTGLFGKKQDKETFPEVWKFWTQELFHK